VLDYLKGEIGGLLIAVFGYLLRELSENQSSPHKIAEGRGSRFFIRLVLAGLAGALVMAALPADTPNYVRVGLLAFAGAATPEIVRLLVLRAFLKLDKTTKPKED